MLKRVTAYSQWANVEPLLMNVINPDESELLEVRNIDGLGPVNAEINTTPKGGIAGSNYVGSSVGERNIVFTLGLNPDWQDWTPSRIRRLLEKYFLPQMSVRLVFETMEFDPVEISGVVESNDPNVFSKDPEQQISIICPDVYFTSVDTRVIMGDTTMDPIEIDYQGNVETGFNVDITNYTDPGAGPGFVGVRIFNPGEEFMEVALAGGTPPVSPTKRLELNTIPGNKYIHNIALPSMAVTSVLNYTEINARWLVLGPGTETFEVYSNVGEQAWTLTYNDLFGGL